jgi:hypothetical protein
MKRCRACRPSLLCWRHEAQEAIVGWSIAVTFVLAAVWFLHG